MGRGKVGCFNYSANFVMRNREREYGSLGQTLHVVHQCPFCLLAWTLPSPPLPCPTLPSPSIPHSLPSAPQAPTLPPLPHRSSQTYKQTNKERERKRKREERRRELPVVAYQQCWPNLEPTQYGCCFGLLDCWMLRGILFGGQAVKATLLQSRSDYEALSF